MRSRFALVLTAALLAGCTMRHGEWLDTYPPATGPAGLTAQLRLLEEDRGEMTGELLAVEDRGLLVLHRDTVVRVHYPRIDWATFPDRRALRVSDGQPPAPAVRDTLRLLSRFPQGVDENLLRRLLDAYGQEDLVEIGASPPDPGSGTHAGHPVGTPAPLEPSSRASPDPVEAFVTAVRQATARFHDRGIAIREGYRKLGPDFPAMGEHWIQPGLVIDGAVDPARPPVLTYATLEGRVTLTGVAYTLPLGRGEEPPPFLGRTDVWHDHSSRVDEESLLLNHRPGAPRGHGSSDGRGGAGGHGGNVGPGDHDAGPPPGPRLAMVHVWAWVESPDGVLAQHNRALPFRRVGLPVPSEPPPAVHRALSLAGSGADYYEALLVAATDGTPADRARFRRALEGHRARVETWVAENRGGAPPPDRTALVAIWRSLWRELEESGPPAMRERLVELRTALEG